ncbi:MAG: preprotein translocase subunit SecE [Deltaproteobacteria bacterium]|nr:MAG: preprotein translocase subunit SecE [Deltaproteobacteria bacterium]
MRHLPWVILSIAISAILTAMVVSTALHSALMFFGIADIRVLGSPLALSTVIAVVVGLAGFLVVLRTRKYVTFIDEVVGELAKVSWPTREETVKASITVVGTTIFTAALLASYDYVFKNIADYFLFNQS